MKFHSLERLTQLHDSTFGGHIVRLVVAAIAGLVILAGITMALPLG